MSSFYVMGGVDFPLDSIRWIHTNEKGMFVRLIAVPKPGAKTPLGLPMQHCVLDGNLVGDDRPKLPLFDRQPGFYGAGSQSLASENFDEEMRRANSAVDFLFPFRRVGSEVSIPCLGVLTLGSTNWCGHDGEYWSCSKANLNAMGRLMYNGFEELYKSAAHILLTTWVST